MLSKALKQSQSHLVEAAAALGPYVVKDDHLDGNVLKALECIEQAIVSIICANNDNIPTLYPQYNTTELEAVMHAWVKK